MGVETYDSKSEALIAMLGKLTSGVLMKPLPCSRAIYMLQAFPSL